MTEFEPDYRFLAQRHANLRLATDVERMKAVTAALRHQEQAAGWVLVRKDDVRTLYNEHDYSDAWIAAADRLEATLAATEEP